MRKKNLSLISIILFILACKKNESTPSYPEFRAYVGTNAEFGDTTYQSLAAVGHLNTPDIIKNPDHATYSNIGSDVYGPTYYYSPEKDFHGTDSVIFKSIEPSLKETVISTYYFSVP